MFQGWLFRMRHSTPHSKKNEGIYCREVIARDIVVYRFWQEELAGSMPSDCDSVDGTVSKGFWEWSGLHGQH